MTVRPGCSRLIRSPTPIAHGVREVNAPANPPIMFLMVTRQPHWHPIQVIRRGSIVADGGWFGI
jgi:hypothetical protein